LKALTRGQVQRTLVKATTVRPKPTSSIPSHSSQAQTDFLHSKSFKSGQNQLLPFQTIPVGPKPTSSILSHSYQAKMDLLYSMPFQSGQHQLSPLQCNSGQADIVTKSSLFCLSCRSWSPNYSVLV
jgi:hypothetical protein